MTGNVALGELGQALHPLERGLELIHFAGNGVRRGGRDQALHRTQEQGSPHFLLQLVQTFGNGTLGHVQGLGGLGHVLCFHQGLENLDIPFIHGNAHPFIIIPIRN